MMFSSIRSRLALSFAGIALVAALALGVVLLAILRNYYSNLELAYLRTNAEAIGGLVGAMSSRNAPRDEVQSQIENMAFLTQTRIQVFSSDNALLYDSGSPQNMDVNLGVMPPRLSLEVNGNTPVGETVIAIVPKDEKKLSSPAVTTSSEPMLNRVFVYSSAPHEGATFGFALKAEAITGSARSKLAVTLHVQNAYKAVDVRLSEGPAYGSAILTSVARGWAFASAIAVLLAAGMGWYISRRISAPVLALTAVTTRMAQGDLSGRAIVRSRDEFDQLARSFNEMAGRIENTVTTLRRFVSDAAHELQTPLTALRTNLELAASETTTAGQAANLERALDEAIRLSRLTEGLLDLSRLESNRGIEDFVSIDLATLCVEMSEPYAAQAEQAGQTLILDLPLRPVMVQGSPLQLQRAVSNLLDNALKFTPQGGTITIGLGADEHEARLYVQDTGIGVPEEDLGLLFNRFHRGRNAAAYPGSGLGLAIVRAILQAHRGRVWAEAAPGGGSRFTMVLPLEAE